MKKICSIFLSLLVILSCVLFCSACGEPSMDDVFKCAIINPYCEEEYEIKFSEIASTQPEGLWPDDEWINHVDSVDYNLYARRDVKIHGIYILDTDTDELEYTHYCDGTYTAGERITNLMLKFVVTKINYDLI